MRWETVATVALLVVAVGIIVSSVGGLVADWRRMNHQPNRGRSRC